MNVTSNISVITSHSLQSYSTVFELYNLLKEMTKNDVFQETYSKFASDISSIFDYFNNEKQNPEYNGHLSVLELQAIMLRLSRHHIKRAKKIENIAHFFMELIEFHNQENSVKPFLIHFENSEYIDRPSLMVLNRLLWLSQNKGIEIEFNYHFDKNIFEATEDHNVVQSRVQVFKKLDRLTDFGNYSIFGNELLTSDDFLLEENLYNIQILDAAIIEQNFELAQLILYQSLKSSKKNKIIPDQIAYRNMGVIESNLGNFKKALEYFDNAIKKSESVLEISRNSYIKGLCLIKRLKKVEEGLETIGYALNLIENNYQNSVKFKHEKAWLLNGLCLGKTILASKMSQDEKKKEFVNIIQLEMDAYKIISKETSFRLVYLKFNLLANMAFLLEILGDYNKAINFWERSFSPILANDGEYHEGEKALTYRLGILRMNLGQYEQSEALLNRSLKLTRDENNPFHLNAILYALSYLKILQGFKEETLGLIKEGKELSVNLGDSNSVFLFNKAFQYLNGEINLSALEHPKVKLISYIPYIDLSFVPEIDLNKALVSKGDRSND